MVHGGFNPSINLPFECRQVKLQNAVLVLKKPNSYLTQSIAYTVYLILAGIPSP